MRTNLELSKTIIVRALTHLLLLEAVPASTFPIVDVVSNGVVLPLPPPLHALGAAGVRVTANTTRLTVFAFFYGLSFGLTPSMLTIQPAYLFGRAREPP